jgi:glycosyltransferase involved in cell wall biosynthesis
MFVSLILPVRNGEWCLPYSLESIFNQDRLPDEILVCIGKCTDNTEHVVLELQKKSPVPFKILYDRDGIGTGYAVNILTTEAKGEVILWIDADHIKPKDWVKQILIYFEQDKDLTYLRERGEENSSSVMSYFKVPEIEYKHSIKYDTKYLISPAGMMAFRRKAVLDVGNFDPFFARGQDLDMTVRLLHNNDKGGECTPYGHHFGINGKKNFWKPLKTPTFFKFLYKYGLKYCLVDKYGFLALGIRTIFLLSIVALLLGQIYLSIAGFFIFFLGFYIGFKTANRKFTFNILYVQMLNSIGEYYQLYKLLTNKNRPALGYGSKWMQ